MTWRFVLLAAGLASMCAQAPAPPTPNPNEQTLAAQFASLDDCFENEDLACVDAAVEKAKKHWGEKCGAQRCLYYERFVWLVVDTLTNFDSGDGRSQSMAEGYVEALLREPDKIGPEMEANLILYLDRKGSGEVWKYTRMARLRMWLHALERVGAQPHELRDKVQEKMAEVLADWFQDSDSQARAQAASDIQRARISAAEKKIMTGSLNR